MRFIVYSFLLFLAFVKMAFSQPCCDTRTMEEINRANRARAYRDKIRDTDNPPESTQERQDRMLRLAEESILKQQQKERDDSLKDAGIYTAASAVARGGVLLLNKSETLPQEQLKASEAELKRLRALNERLNAKKAPQFRNTFSSITVKQLLVDLEKLPATANKPLRWYGNTVSVVTSTLGIASAARSAALSYQMNGPKELITDRGAVKKAQVDLAENQDSDEKLRSHVSRRLVELREGIDQITEERSGSGMKAVELEIKH